MIKQRKLFLSLLSLISIHLFQLDASAQSNQFVRRNPTRTTQTAPPAQLPATQKGNPNPKIIKENVVEALEAIQKNYFGARNLNYNNLFKSSITVMLRTLDPYSTYYDAEEFDGLKSDPRSANFGIGVTIGDRKIGEETGVFVLYPLQRCLKSRKYPQRQLGDS